MIADGVFEVKALGGQPPRWRRLGPARRRLAGHEFKNTNGIDLSNDRWPTQRLQEAAERAKIELSSTQETSINLPFITAPADGPLHLDD